MGYVTLYRKWRPQSFNEVIGQQHIVRTLTNAINGDRVAHAFLFSGPRGTGKTSVAKVLAKSINCEKGSTPTPCQTCANCIEITSGSSLDVIEIDAASNRGIDEIRDLREKVKFIPAGCQTKVYIIDEVHMLTPEAFNALLKMLEEPPSHVVFVLATTEPHRVLPTIISRCQHFDFGRLKISEIVDRLSEVSKAEGIEVDKQAFTLIARNAQGSMRDAVSSLDQLAAFTGNKIARSDVVALFGLTENSLLVKATEIIGDGNTGGVLDFIEEITNEGWNLRQLIKDLGQHFRNLLILKSASGSEEILNIGSDELKELKVLSELFSEEEVLTITERLNLLVNELRFSADDRLTVEVELVKLARSKGKKKDNSQKVTQAEVIVEDKQKPGPEIKPKNEKVQIKKEKGTEPTTTGKAKEDTGDSDRLDRVWDLVRRKVREQKISTYALILECRPRSLGESEVVLEFGTRSDFHKKEVEKPQNREVIEKALSDILREPTKIKCQLKDREDIDRSMSTVDEKAASSIEDKQQTDKVDEEEMVNKVAKSFDAKVIDEGV